MDVLRRLDRFALVLAAVFAMAALVGVAWLGWADRTPLREVPKRLAQGKELRLEHWMAIGFRRAAIASTIVGTLAVITAAWWGKRTRLENDGRWIADDRAGKRGSPHQLVWAAALIVLIGAGLRIPRLFHSFWNDEAYAARTYVWGLKEPQLAGALVFKPVTWSQALFLNEKGNNHVWCTLEARWALKAWQSVTGRGADEFNEVAMRLPAFLWGLLTIAAVTLLGSMTVGPRGILAGLLLAVHPWHVRFSVEMRGYSAMLLALTLGVIFLLHGLRDGRWRWWLASAAMNLWALLAFAGCLYVPVVANAALLGWLLGRKRWILAGRLVVANALALIPFLWLFGPSLPQLTAYLKSGAAAAAYQIDASWLKSLWSSLCLGADFRIMSQAWWERVWLPSPTWQSIALAVVSMAFCVQAARWLRARPAAGAVPLAFLLAGGAGIAQNMLTRSPVVVWYFLPMLLGWVIVMPGPPVPGGDGPGTPRRWGSDGSVVALSLVIACLIGNAKAFSSLEHQPMRSAAGRLGLHIGSAHTAAVGVSDRQLLLYDPRVAIVHTVAEIEMAEQAAAAAGQPLVISVCGWDESHRRAPEVMARLRAGDYRVVADLPGWEAMFSYRLLQKIP
jgi:Dolichyl-phosphate-mannose-protein mannosyltransferase